MTSITPNGSGRGFPFHRAPWSAPWFLESTTNSFEYPAFTSYPKWSFNTRHCSVMCPLSLWYVQYKFWFLQEGSPSILFSHLKNSSFLIQSTVLCTGSLNATFTSPICAFGSYILKSFHGLEGKMPCREWFNSGALPLLYNQSSSMCLYS